MPALISPSILSADFANLERDVAVIAGADYAHVDVMDNHFVPNLTLGLPIVRRLVEVSPVPIDVHLMIDDADRWAPGFAEFPPQYDDGSVYGGPMPAWQLTGRSGARLECDTDGTGLWIRSTTPGYFDLHFVR